MKIILTTASDDGYASLLLDMLESLGSQLQKHDLGILDLGLSEETKNKIRKLKPETIFKEPQWFIKVHKKRRNVFSQATQSKAFVNQIYPNYDAYLHIDSDIWFQDSTAIDDFILAAKNTGFAAASSTHALKPPCTAKLRAFHFLFNAKYKLIASTWAARQTIAKFGHKEAMPHITKPTINAGIYLAHADSPIWEAWQKAMRKPKWHKTKKNVCDETCLFFALYKYEVPMTLLSIHHNWGPNEDNTLFDEENKQLVDVVYPHTPIKVVHLAGKNAHKIQRSIKTTNGGTIKAILTHSEMKKI